jgi:AraC family cel operon transcriptional repressor
MTSSDRLRWAELELASPAHAFIRAFYPLGYRFPDHRHDFHEVTLVESGEAVHHVGGAELPLRENDLVFIHPDDRHALAAGRAPAVFVNLVFPRELVEAVERRFAADAPGPWPWARGCAARALRLPPGDRAWLAAWVRELERPARAGARLAAEAFVLDLTRRCAQARAARGESRPPAWLLDTLALLDEPRGLVEGVAGLARRSGRGREHLGRLTRRHFGCTTVELVARRRLEHAARRLLGTTLPIAEIAAECGYASASHFHARFRAFHRCTPEAYRGRRAPLRTTV